MIVSYLAVENRTGSLALSFMALSRSSCPLRASFSPFAFAEPAFFSNARCCLFFSESSNCWYFLSFAFLSLLECWFEPMKDKAVALWGFVAEARPGARGAVEFMGLLETRTVLRPDLLVFCCSSTRKEAPLSKESGDLLYFPPEAVDYLLGVVEVRRVDCRCRDLVLPCICFEPS